MVEGKSRFQYFRVYQEIKDKIEQGNIKPGEKLPIEKELQDEFQVSRDTVRKALAKLEQEGFIDRKSAVGTFVKQDKSDYELSYLKSFTEQMKSRGIEPSSELERIELKTGIRNDIREQLQLNEDERCYIICRIRKGDGKPMAYETTYIPYKRCPDIHKYLDDQSSLYEIYENVYHLKIGYGIIRLESEMPSSKLQEKLNISKDSSMLFMKCSAFLEDNNPLYYVECSYIGEKYFFSTKIFRV